MAAPLSVLAVLCCWLCWLTAGAAAEAEQEQGYRLGVGIADVTGPPTEVTFMGYAHLRQRGSGLHLRQFSRAFIVDDGRSRFVFVNVDCGMIGNGLRREVLDLLREQHGSLYSEANVLLSGTHTHSAPGGFLQDLLFDLSTLGFVRATFEALAGGIALSVQRAHDAMRPGRLLLTTGELRGISANRSPTAYANNPREERQRYSDDTDKTMVQVRFVGSEGEPLGVINWYAVHGTSMNNTNTLVSSDNLGYAAVNFEKRFNGREAHPGKGPFVAAFATSNEGDASPNTRTPRCLRTGRPCDARTSACAAPRDQCVASGPGEDMFHSTRIVATRLADKAWELWGKEDAIELKGPVGSVHQFVDMPTQRATIVDPRTGQNTTVRGCRPAMGYSFAAGTTDGPGSFSFTQGTLSDNPLWNAVRDLLAVPTPDDIACHRPKPILLLTGSDRCDPSNDDCEEQTMSFPFEWQPRVVSTQLARVGPLVVACVPGEFTTMAGRRLRAAVAQQMALRGEPDARVVVAGLCNTYSDYITTPDEYQVQRYEGASTIFGPHTLTIYLQQYRRLADLLATGERGDPGPSPPDLMDSVVTLQTPVLFDSAPWGHRFGDVLRQPPTSARPGDVVNATFVAGNPRNNLRHGMTYLTVERLVNGRWVIEATDADWETKFLWERRSTFLGTSEATLQWEVPPDVRPGLYRLRHFGAYKYILGGVFDYVGATDNFTVTAGPPNRYSYGSGRRVRALERLR